TVHSVRTLQYRLPDFLTYVRDIGKPYICAFAVTDRNISHALNILPVSCLRNDVDVIILPFIVVFKQVVSPESQLQSITHFRNGEAYQVHFIAVYIDVDIIL